MSDFPRDSGLSTKILFLLRKRLSLRENLNETLFNKIFNWNWETQFESSQHIPTFFPNLRPQKTFLFPETKYKKKNVFDMSSE